MKRAISIICGLIACLSFSSTSGHADNAAFAAAPVLTNPWVIPESKHDETQVPVGNMPHAVSPLSQSPPVHRFITRGSTTRQADLAVQKAAGPALAARQGLDFEGLGAGLPQVSVEGGERETRPLSEFEIRSVVNRELMLARHLEQSVPHAWRVCRLYADTKR